MRKENATNSRTLGRWTRRVLGIAKDLDKSDDLVEQQMLKTVVESVAQQLVDAEGIQPTENISQLSPGVYLRRTGIICEADQILNHFQPPPQGHTEGMQEAISKDDRVLGKLLEEISQADDPLLEEMTETMTNIVRSNERSISENPPLGNMRDQILTSTAFGANNLQNEEKAYEQFGQKLAEYKRGKRGISLPAIPDQNLADCIATAPSIVLVVSDMGSDGDTKAHVIPLNHTFSALVENDPSFNSESFLPDFWSKASDPNRNCITKSGVWWEWQDPSKKVIDAINREGHIGIETVCKEVEYIVILVKEGDEEKGMPIELPRRFRQPALEHLQRHFPYHVVSQVRRLPRGDDVGAVVFDNRAFSHKTNPLFVEVSAEPDEPQSGEQ